MTVCEESPRGRSREGFVKQILSRERKSEGVMDEQSGSNIRSSYSFV